MFVVSCHVYFLQPLNISNDSFLFIKLLNAFTILSEMCILRYRRETSQHDN